jgi:acyl-CoA thioester hydrolase
MKKVSYIEDFQAWKNEFSFSIPIKVRFSETDMFGHVNNVSPFIYFEEARIAFMEEVGIFTDLSEGSDRVPVVADLQCDYHQQMYFGDTLNLYVKANHVGNTSMDIHYMMVNQEEKICITGRGRVVQINPQTGKPVPFNEEQKRVLGI